MHNLQPDQASTDPQRAELLHLPDLFLLNPKNRDFIEGRSQEPQLPDSIEKPSIIGTIVLLIILLPFLGRQVIELQTALSVNAEYRLLEQQGVLTEGTVSARRTLVRRSVRDRYLEQYVTYQFGLPGSEVQNYRNEVRVDDSTYDRLVEGSSVTVIYLPSDPTISDINGIARPVSAWHYVPVIACLGLGLYFITLFVRGKLRIRRWQGLVKEGRLLKATLTEREAEPKNDKWKIYYRFRFTTPDGESIVVNKQFTNATKPDWYFQRLEPNTSAAVLYLNEKHYAIL